MAYTNFNHCTLQEYVEVVYSQDDKNRIKILFNNTELQNADNYCEKLTVYSKILPNDGNKVFGINNFVSKEAELILHKVDLDTIQDQVEISIGTLVNNEYEYVPIGIFNIQDNPTTDKDKITIKLRDNSVKLDFGYSAEDLMQETGKTTYGAILEDICTKAGITCNVSSFDGEDIETGLYDNTINARVYVSYLAEQCGAIPIITRSGELDFIYLNNSITWQIPLNLVQNYEIGTPYKIERIVYESGVIKFQTSDDETLSTLYLDSSNPYINSQEQVDLIFDKLEDFEIDSVILGKMLGNLAIDPYDIIEIIDTNNNNEVICRTLANNTYIYNGLQRQEFSTQIGLEERTENVTLKSDATSKKVAKAEIDAINGRIILLTEEISNTYSTKVETQQTAEGLQTQITQNSEDITTLKATIDGVELDITKAGNNLVKNTMLWNYDYWLSNTYSKCIESPTPPIETDVYWYCTETSGNHEKGIIYDYDYNSNSWVATTLLRSDLNKSAEDLTQIKIFESSETNENFLSKKGWKFNFDGSAVTFDNSEGLFSDIFEISPTQNEMTFSFKAKTNITSGGLNVILYLYDRVQFGRSNMPNRINGIYIFRITESHDYKQYFKKIIIPKLTNVLDVYLDSTAPSDTTKLWLKEIDNVYYIYKYDEEQQEWLMYNEMQNCKDQNDQYYRFLQVNNDNISYYQTSANMNTLAGQLYFVDYQENNYHSYLEAIIGDIKVEYGKLSDWQPARDESYGISFRADGNGLKISKADNNVILDEDELTGYYKENKMFSINKNEVYSEVSRSIISNVNGLITKKLNNNIYIRYIKE